ncbi:EAL domain-containing protein [Acidibrevibacterium fodinaquatile]|uniref:EAL domain-containing protein n=1 Tax=Acidibrevibacterium fodinaquatile TaxID=1969806 RepID=UPI000E0D5DE0|nr:EAL domain-containing protein [Acidibrevibacterium fodinaquatile]
MTAAPHPPRERFVTFSFAAADLLVEATTEGTITFAIGAFHSLLGRPSESFVGQKVRDLVAPGDREALDQALTLLPMRGRQVPMTLRLADKARTPRALAGLLFAEAGRPAKLCLTFAALPLPLGKPASGAAMRPVLEAAQARVRQGEGGELNLLEISASDPTRHQGVAIGAVLEEIIPGALVGEAAPGRISFLAESGPSQSIVAVVAELEAALRTHGVTGTVAAQRLSLAADALTPDQMARALRHALGVFARGGIEGLAKAGFAGGLADYVRQAGKHAAALRRAIREERYQLLYQPIVRLGDRGLHHYEALLRPQAINGVEIGGTQDFVTLIETVGLAHELDLAVAKRAAAVASHAPAPIAFNISSLSLQDGGFRAGLLAQLAGAAKGRVIVEMTETAEIEDLEQVRQGAEALRGLGIPFCLDDFGAGSADMRILRAVPADYVKLDGSYVPGVAQPGRERDFVAAMAEIARAAGCAMVAERIESESEAEILHGLGITYGQGWLFGRAGPLPENASGVARRRGASAGKWE